MAQTRANKKSDDRNLRNLKKAKFFLRKSVRRNENMNRRKESQMGTPFLDAMKKPRHRDVLQRPPKVWWTLSVLFFKNKNKKSEIQRFPNSEGNKKRKKKAWTNGEDDQKASGPRGDSPKRHAQTTLPAPCKGNSTQLELNSRTNTSDFLQNLRVFVHIFMGPFSGNRDPGKGEGI